jgi:hypothetical protein
MVFRFFYFAASDILEISLIKTLSNYANLTETFSRIYVPAYWHLVKDHRWV